MSNMEPDEGERQVEEGVGPVAEGLQAPDRGAWQVAAPDMDEDDDQGTEQGERGASQ